jgi:hypothetical protein
MPILNGVTRIPEKREGRVNCAAHLYLMPGGVSAKGLMNGSLGNGERFVIVSYFAALAEVEEGE